MKKTFLFVVFVTALFFFCDANLMAQSGTAVATKLNNVYTSFIRPVLIAWLIIMIAIAGVLTVNKVRKNDEESSDAIMGFLKMVIWPIVVLGVAEIGHSLYN